MIHTSQFADRFVLGPLGFWAAAGQAALAPFAPYNPAVRVTQAGLEAMGAFAGPSAIPGYDLDVAPEVRAEAPFGRLLHFPARYAAPDAPRYLVIAPLSGHHATLLRPTVDALLDTGEVDLVEWHSADDVPLSEGVLGYERYVAHLDTFLDAMAAADPDRPFHAVAVCQPGPALVTALAARAMAGGRAQPDGVSLLAAPMDPAAGGSSLARSVAGHGARCLPPSVTERVPFDRAGVGREIVPGRLQIWTMMAQNPVQHMTRCWTLFRQRLNGQHNAADAVVAFYERFGALIAIDAALYRDTLARVFAERELAAGTAHLGGEPVDPAALTDLGVQTIAGGADPICAPEQTHAAHDILAGAPERLRDRLTVPGLGHYDVFAGPRFRAQILPRITAFALACRSARAEG